MLKPRKRMTLMLSDSVDGRIIAETEPSIYRKWMKYKTKIPNDNVMRWKWIKNDLELIYYAYENWANYCQPIFKYLQSK